MEDLRASWLWQRVGVACKDNNKVDRCSVSGVAGQVGCDDRLVFGCGYKVAGLRNEKTSARALPKRKPPTL